MQEFQRTHTQHVCRPENGLNWKFFGHSALLWLDMEGCDVTFVLRAAWKQTWNCRVIKTNREWSVSMNSDIGIFETSFARPAIPYVHPWLL
jgi:hypothetical protein